MTAAYVADTDALGLERPDAEPLASGTIGEIVSLIQSLIDSGHAYQANGDVYFRVRSFDGYGKLSNRDPAEMDQGEEAGTASLKEDPLDFALWKGHKEGEDTSWDSPWGRGRPGWHIECSAMSEKELGPDFAIHGGGIDLVFPHHENEIAQTEAARGVPLAEIWMHNGMVQLDEEKMSKSVGNIFQLSEAIERYGGQTVVAYLISGHYRQPLAFSDEQLQEAAARVERIRNYFRDAPSGEPDPFLVEKRQAFLDALADDFNTPQAFAVLFEIVNEGNKRELSGAREVLTELLPLLGLDSLIDEEEAAPARPSGSCRAREGPRREGLRPCGRAPRRARRDGLGGPRRGGRRPAGAAADRRARQRADLRPPPGCRGRAGRRRVHRVWRAPDTPPEELERLCGSPDHQGVVAEVDPYPYADPGACSRRRTPWSSSWTRCRTRTISAPSAGPPRWPAPRGW